MQFYKVRCVVDDSEIFQSERRPGRYRISKKLADVVARSKIYNQENRKERYVFLYMASENTGEMVFGLIVKDEEDPTKIMKDFFSYVGLKHKNAVGTENTLCDTLGMLRRADNDYDYEMYEALSDFSITVFDSFRNGFSEYLFDVWKDEDNYKRAGEISVKTSLREELDRIAMGKKKKRANGIPCTYVIETDDRTLGEVASQCIMRALYNHGRIRSRRFTVLRLDTDHLSRRIIEKVYFSSGKGTVVIDARSNDVNESEFDTGLRGALLAICEVMNRFDNVQTVFIFGRECKNIKDEIISELENETLVEIVEDYYDVESSKMHLAALASKDGLSGDKQLFAYAEECENHYASELEKHYRAWYKKKLKSSVYPQYSKFESTSSAAVKKDANGKAYAELQKMIGLSNVKEIIDSAINYNKAQKLFKEHDMPTDSMSRHMIFTGNPGTAKTTVARLFASIMRDNKVLSRGHIVEVGRGDLVGRFVGWTAPTVQRKFKEASGGVLFIDEAYSLVDDRDGLYGDEAINTIVQEMENHRDDVIVIFAGYPDKMEGFLGKNPGLSSRIAFHVPFEDYTAEQLCDIADIIAGRYKMKIEDEARVKLKTIFDNAITEEDFGNGRYVRNIIEKARMKQADRLIKMDVDKLTDADIKTLKAGDIEVPAKLKSDKKTYGFVV